MNQVNTKTKGGPMARAPETKAPPASGGPGGAAAVPAPPPKIIEVNPMFLSVSLARDLERIPQVEWFKIESVPWRVPFTRDMAEGVRFVDAVAYVVNQHGGLFASQDLHRRRDLEQSSQEVVDAFQAFIRTTVKVARKLGLTTILQRHWRLLSVYGSPPKKTDAAKADGGPAEAA